MNKAQRFLLEHGCNDLRIKGDKLSPPQDWVYVSEILTLYADAQKTAHNSDIKDLGTIELNDGMDD